MKCLVAVPVVLWALATTAQSSHVVPAGPQEFPAILSQNIEAGKTAAGTAVSARLMIGTLAGGVVIPEGAVLSGVVEQSFVKMGKQPTRLKIHITQVAWRDRTLALDLYFSDQFYPQLAVQAPEPTDFDASNSRMRGVDVESRNIVGRGGVTAASIVVNTPPRATIEGATQSGRNGHGSGAMSGFSRRVKLKGLAAVPDGTGGVAVISDAKNVKLDRTTCYSFQGIAPVPETGLHASK